MTSVRTMRENKKKSRIKRGKLGQEDKRIIEQMCLDKSDEEIAAKLRRPLETVRDYRISFLAHNPNIVQKKSLNQEVRDQLHLEPEWEYFKEQYTDDELVLFEHSYAELMQQFNCDVLPTEKKQIFHSINLEILIHRHNHDRMLAQKDIERLERLIDKEYAKGEGNWDQNTLLNLEQQLQGARAAGQSRTNELKSLLDKHSALLKDLKGVREQRISKIESAKHSFVGLLRQLEEEEFRANVGVEMNLMGAATNKEKERLSQYHTYMDKGIDKPLLTPETVMADK